uniref:PPUP7658 n=1 Tax=Poeciliopsis prolifica TaxID=188132 RepID=A0A0S7EPS2_9TELE
MRPDRGNVSAQLEKASRLHCGDMSAHILQHSARKTVNISSLQTSNSGGSTLTTQTGQGTATGLWCMHELYWGFLFQSSSNPKQSYFLGAERERLACILQFI